MRSAYDKDLDAQNAHRCRISAAPPPSRHLSTFAFNILAHLQFPRMFLQDMGMLPKEDSRFYAGIGSRSTPVQLAGTMERAAARLSHLGWTLRSGAASGADEFFEKGAKGAGATSVAANTENTEIWLPWRGFRGHSDTGFYPGEEHFAYAAQHHPAWNYLTRGPRALHARNVGQILGRDLQTPVRFVLCWTQDGCEHYSARTKETGGTGMAIEMASRLDIPVFNMRHPDALHRLAELLQQLQEQESVRGRAGADRPRPSWSS